MERRKGTIETGKDADLILLDENPLTDIRNTRKINGVFIGQTWYNRTALDQLLREASALSR
jgi:imidazolonepropionase-like amidohydrolase